MDNIICTIAGVSVVEATCKRIKKEEQKDHLFYYNLRHPDNNWGEPYSVEKLVWVNHFGTIATTQPILELETNTTPGVPVWVELNDDQIQSILDTI